jgi:carboxylesterase
MKKRKLPVLLLHGFTSSLDCVKKPAEVLREAGFEVVTPLLRGHGTRWEDLKGVVAADWFDDGKKALDELAGEPGRPVAVVGLSMGGLVALDLAIRFPGKVAMVLGAAPALEFSNPLSPASKYLARLFPSFPSPNAFTDQELRRKFDTNYKKFPTRTFAQLFAYSREVRGRLDQLTVPVHLIHSLKDQVVPPRATRHVLETARSERKSVSWYSRSGHELFLDCEADAVAAEVRDVLVAFEEGL